MKNKKSDDSSKQSSSYLSRREFLKRMGSAAVTTLLAGIPLTDLLAAHGKAPAGIRNPNRFFSPEQLRIVEALTEMILPAGDGLPGAQDMHVSDFIDRALTTFMKDAQKIYTDGLSVIETKTAKLFPNSATAAALSPAQLKKVADALGKLPLLDALWTHTVIGALTDPKYGGNFKKAGWKLIGFDDAPVNQPPFGYYDRHYVSPYPKPSPKYTGAAALGSIPKKKKVNTRYKPQEEVDFVIVGAGAAGGVVAWELSRRGFDVVVLEQGPHLSEKDFHHDQIEIYAEHRLTNDQRTQPQTFRKTPKEKARPGMSATYGRAVGGGSIHFSANFWRFRPIDFKERSVLGPISGTGFADWPISYEELEPYYTRAERILGVSGQAGVNPFDPPRSAPYPLPPLPVKSSGVIFERAAKKLGWHPFPEPLAILSQPYDGRPACMHCGWCEGFGCEFGAKSSSLATVIRAAERTGHCEIRPNSYVRKIEIDKQGRAKGVIYFDQEKNEILQHAKAVVVCANGCETPRLLLMSKSNLFPDGLANSSGLVGKYLMWNAGSETYGRFDHELNDYKSVQASRVLWDFYDSDPKRGFYGGGGLDARKGPAGVAAYALSTSPQDQKPLRGNKLRRHLHDIARHVMVLEGHTTALPLETNAVDLDPELKDDWGLPAMRVTYDFHPDDIKTMKFFANRSLELLDAAGAVEKYVLSDSGYNGSVHLQGTCRMGDDPSSSVVDRYHRTHDVRNLFLVDGSSFVSTGRGQPTLTIQALAFRAGEYLAAAAKRGDI
ncbi:MAG TPA: GMC family oxidoreductase [Balneolaceae bacterium]|nr:GMC family oxidoreductase [Balneolaceae bacterium]